MKKRIEQHPDFPGGYVGMEIDVIEGVEYDAHVQAKLDFWISGQIKEIFLKELSELVRKFRI